MRSGVSIIDPLNTYVECRCGNWSGYGYLPRNNYFRKNIDWHDCIIGPNSEINDCTVGNGTVIRQSVAFDVELVQR